MNDRDMQLRRVEPEERAARLTGAGDWPETGGGGVSPGEEPGWSHESEVRNWLSACAMFAFLVVVALVCALLSGRL